MNRALIRSTTFVRAAKRVMNMIADDRELQATFDRLARLQAQVSHLRQVESNPTNYRLSASGFLAEIDRMQLAIREYLSVHPAEMPTTVL